MHRSSYFELENLAELEKPERKIRIRNLVTVSCSYPWRGLSITLSYEFAGQIGFS